ncbi:TPA: hypothetical protein OZL93_003233, partial [Legionella pneumophila]|nr:hypothetical protein [Legionella pneumophila]
MIEILPNWHPIFVHFTVALTSIATFFFCLGFIFQNINFGKELLVAGRFCLWTGVFFLLAMVGVFPRSLTIDCQTNCQN